MKKLVLIFTFILVQVLLFGATAESLLKPQNTAYDFTYNTNTNLNTYQATQYVNKVEMQVDKILGIVPRLNKIFDCKNDVYGNTYCPEALEIAGSYTAYKASTAYERTGTVTDYEKGNYAEHIGTVRDFMDGFASSHTSNVTDYQTGWGTQNVGTVIDYQSNSTATTYTGSVVDFTKKISVTNNYSLIFQNVVATNETKLCTQLGSVCAGENGTCSFSGTKLIAYGSNGTYVYKTASNSISCSNSTFGDPTPGSVKYCYIVNQAEMINNTCPSGYSYLDWVNCSAENSTCYVDGLKTVRYGANGSYSYINANNSVYCSNSVFGDPINGVTKTCSYKNTTIQQVSTSTASCPAGTNDNNIWLTCSSENGTCSFSGTQVVRYGGNGSYYYKSNVTGSIACNNATFGDPAPGIPKGCSYSQGTNCQSATTKCPDTYGDNGTNCQKTVNYNFYSYQCPNGYTPVNSGFTSYSKSDPDTSNINDYTLDDAVNSATPPPSNCKKTITYSYYKYNCPTGYTINDNGLYSACPRTDPNNTTYDEASLSQPCNNATPPTGNCSKIIPYTFYSYECSSGYTAIDPGLATCTKTDSSTSSDTSATLDDPCNSVTPPKENCYKDISYKHYTYGCSPGYVTDNYGLSTCPKTDPNKSINNSATLDDACNSATPPPGNCQKPIEFSYFQYICTGTNAFGETYSPINPGLNSCNKTDPNNITVNGTTLDDACNSSTPPVNNCQATEYTCNSNIIKPALVDGKWQCSPYVCNSEQKCGTATCNDYPPSKEFFMEESLLPMKPDYNGSCVGVLCDMTMNKNISYCDAGETCPKINGVYTKNGKCYYDDCPQGSFLDANGNCVVD